MTAPRPAVADGQAVLLMRRYRRQLWLAGLPVVLLLLGLAGWQAWQAHQQTDRQVDHTAALYQSALQGLADAATQHVSDLRAVLALPLPPAFARGQGERFIEPSIRAGLAARPGQSPGAAGDGVSLDGLAEAQRAQTGQLIWPGEGVASRGPGPDVLWRQGAFAQVAGRAQSHQPELAWSYFFGWPQRHVMLFPFAEASDVVESLGHPTQRAALASWYEYEVFSASLPGRNPLGQPYWTAAYLDAGGQGWMVSHAAPVRRDGQFVGMVGTDIRLDSLGRVLAALPGMPARWWVVSDRQEVLAESDPASPAATAAASAVLSSGSSASSVSTGPALAPQLESRLPPGLGLSVVKEARALPGQPLEREGFRVLALPVQGAPWTLLVVMEEGEALKASALGTLPLLLLALGLIALFAYAQAQLQGRVLVPLLALLAYLEAKAGDARALAPDLGLRWQTWVDTVTRTFDSERLARVQQRRSEAMKGAIVDYALSAIVVTDAAGCVVEFNPAAERMFGYSRSAALGQPVADLIIPPAKRHGHDEGMRRMAAGGAPRMLGKRLQLSALRADGSEFPIEMVLWRTDLEGEVHYTATLADMSLQQSAKLEIERQREALRQSEKLAAMGGLLAGVAHELNNPLAIAMGRASWLEERSTDPVVQGDARLIREATERCGRIVRTFLDMARSRPVQPEALGLNELVLAAVDLLAHSLRSQGVAVQLDLAAGLPAVWADADRLGQVVINLIVNAQQALGDSAAPRELILSSGRGESAVGTACVWLRVADNGPGVSPAVRERLFEPFFTTKPEGVGTGMGLALSRSMVEEQGGELVLEPEGLRGGASFLVRLRPAEAAGAAPAPALAEAEAPVAEPAAPRVLVVDDEPELAALWCDWLEAAGYEVLRAESGEVALEMLTLCSVDAMVSDLRMPGMDGGELWRRVARRQPSLKRRTLFVTGDTLSAGVADFLHRSACPALEKPFNAADLVGAVAALLGKDEAASGSPVQPPPGLSIGGPGTNT